MKIKLYLVDDEKDFLESFHDIPLDNCVVKSFIKPMEAIKGISIDQPAIVVSDVQMPDIHGLDFIFIVKQILPSTEIILISANHPSDIREKYGEFDGIKFFQKPLDEQFYEYLEQAVARGSLKKNTEELRPALEIETQINKFRNLFKMWKEYQDFQYKVYLENQFLSPLEDTDAERLEKLRESIEACKKLIGVDETEWQQIVSELKNSTSPWYTRVLNSVGEMCRRDPICLAREVKINHTFLLGDEDLMVKELSLKSDGDDVYIMINGKPWRREIVEGISPRDRAKSVLMTLGKFDILRTAVAKKLHLESA